MKAIVIVISSILISILLIKAAKHLRKRNRVWLFMEDHDGVIKERALVSIINPRPRKQKNGLPYSCKQFTFGYKKTRKDWYLEPGSIKHILGKAMSPEEKSIPVYCQEINKVGKKLIPPKRDYRKLS